MKPFHIVLIGVVTLLLVGYLLKFKKKEIKAKSCSACSNKASKGARYQPTDIPARTYIPEPKPGPRDEPLNPFNDYYDNTDIDSHPTMKQGYTYESYRLML